MANHYDLRNILQPETREYFMAGITAATPAETIMQAALAGNAQAIRNLVEANRIVPDFSNAHGTTPLMAATVLGHMDVVEYLSSHPLVNINHQNRWGWTALHYAAYGDDGSIVSALLSHHADRDLCNNDGETALMLAKKQEIRDLLGKGRKRKKTELQASFISTAAVQMNRVGKSVLPSPAPAAKTYEAFISYIRKLSEQKRTAEIFEYMQNDGAPEFFDKMFQNDRNVFEAGFWDNAWLSVARSRPDFIQSWHRYWHLPSQSLMRAVAMPLMSGEMRGLRELMYMGFDPFEVVDNGRSPMTAALETQNMAALQEMMLFSKKIPPRRQLDKLEKLWKQKGDVKPETDEQFWDILQYGHNRTLLTQINSSGLAEYLRSGCSTEMQHVQCYLEGKRTHTFKKQTRFGSDLLQSKLVEAYEKNWTVLADMLERDGYHIDKCNNLAPSRIHTAMRDRYRAIAAGSTKIEKFVSYKEHEDAAIKKMARRTAGAAGVRYGAGWQGIWPFTAIILCFGNFMINCQQLSFWI